MISVDLMIETKADSLPSISDFEKWVNTAVNAVSDKAPLTCCEISIIIVDEAQSAALNETYRHKKGPTNVLSFGYEPVPGITQTTLGDLVICASVMKAEADAEHIPLQSHWAHLTVHGTLHLLGYDHVVEQDANAMESLEIKILKTLGFEDPYT